MIFGTALGENPLYPSTWKVTSAINDINGDSHEWLTKVKFSGTTSTCSDCGHFESVPGWDFDNNGFLTQGYFNPQQWHILEWHIKLSTGTCNAVGTGTENGVFEMWIDGVKQNNNYLVTSMGGTSSYKDRKSVV